MLCNGYKMIYMPDHPKAYKNGCVYEHIVEAEKMIGRYLREGEVVHHEDRNRTNNSHENLKVFHTNIDHVLYHSGASIYLCGGVYIADKTANKQHRYCSICGKKKSRKAKMCRDCYNQIKAINIPSKEEIEQMMVSNMSFVKMGEQYGVTDNAVRKWCKIHGLPFRRDDVKRYIDKIRSVA